MMISDLPLDLESDILTRVPTKSLPKLKTTCKRWYMLFKDPKFVKNKLGTTTTEEVILLMKSRVYSVNLNLRGIHNSSFVPSMDFKGKLRRLNDSKDVKISEIFHCGGLMLCSTVGNKRLAVWNPCTGENRWIIPRTCYKSINHFVLGYGQNNLTTCRSYKILRFCRYFNVELHVQVYEFDIYDFNSNLWRVLDDVNHKWCELFSEGVSLNGNTYWVASNTERDLDHVLLTFDFTTERFGYSPLPFQNYNSDFTEVLSVVREEKLALLHNNDLFEVKIWMTNANIGKARDLTWTIFLEVDFNKFMITGTQLTSVISFLVDEEQKMIVYCDLDQEYKTGIFLLGEDIHKEIKKGSYGEWPLLFSYVPSLVQIRRNTPKGKRKR